MQIGFHLRRWLTEEEKQLKIDISVSEEMTIKSSLQMRLAKLKSRKHKDDYVKKEIKKIELLLQKLDREDEKEAKRIMKMEG